jgi:hypothetical protein
LSQWRAYGQSGGYCLGFHVPSEGINRSLMPEPTLYTAKWLRVEYDRNEQKRRCNGILDAVLPIFDEPDVSRAVKEMPDAPEMGYTGFLRLVSDMLLEEIVGFKDEAFAVEKEWQIVVRSRELLRQGADDGGRTLNFRSARGLLTPYIKLVPLQNGELLPLASIRSGPTMDKKTAGLAIQLLLRKQGYIEPALTGQIYPCAFSGIRMSRKMSLIDC